MKTFLLVAFTFLAMNFASAQQAKTVELTMKTSAECGDCKERVENKLNYTKGVIFSELDYKTKMLTVKYKTSKISLDEIKTLVSDLGYDIDDVKANPVAQNNLPECCQPGGHAH